MVACAARFPWSNAPSSAAAGPLPETSPIAKPNRPSGRSTYSKKSPPIDRHASISAAASKNAPARRGVGNSACWICAAVAISWSSRAFSRAARYSWALSMATAASAASVSSVARVPLDNNVPFSRLSR